jgi:hypothetical protein
LLSTAILAGSLFSAANSGARELGAAAPGPLADTSQDISIPVAEPKKFGDLNQDLVYTPVQPCRIVDTRNTAAGVIAGGASRSFVAIAATNFTSQGGSATNCGVLNAAATAVAVNFTVVNTLGAAYITVFPFGTSQPLAATMTFGLNDLRSNTAIVQIPNPLSSFDFTVFAAAGTHVVADIVGYFSPPLATALQCVETANTDLAIAGNGGTGNSVAPACATGYTQTATNCETTSWQMPIVYFQSGTCSARNNDTTTQTLRASRTCCRVPGR